MSLSLALRSPHPFRSRGSVQAVQSALKRPCNAANMAELVQPHSSTLHNGRGTCTSGAQSCRFLAVLHPRAFCYPSSHAASSMLRGRTAQAPPAKLAPSLTVEHHRASHQAPDVDSAHAGRVTQADRMRKQTRLRCFRAAASATRRRRRCRRWATTCREWRPAPTRRRGGCSGASGGLSPGCRRTTRRWCGRGRRATCTASASTRSLTRPSSAPPASSCGTAKRSSRGGTARVLSLSCCRSAPSRRAG